MLKRTLPLLALLLLTILALAGASAEGPHSPQNKSAQSHSASIESKCDKPETFWQRTTCDPVAFYTLFLTVFSGLLAAVSFVQIRYLIRADKTARIAAEAARGSAETSSTTAERQLRAYVLADNIGFHASGIAIAQIRNFGQTPAYDVRITIESEWRNRNDSLVHLGFTENRFSHPGTVIPPRHPVSIPADFGGIRLPANEADWPIVQQDGRGRWSLRPFVWGRIEYVDAFSKARWTTFQFFSDMEPGASHMSQCAVGNDADQDSKEERPHLAPSRRPVRS